MTRLFCWVPMKLFFFFFFPREVPWDDWLSNSIVLWLGKWQFAIVLVMLKILFNKSSNSWALIPIMLQWRLQRHRKRLLSRVRQVLICLTLVIIKGWEDIYLVWSALGVTYFMKAKSSGSKRVILSNKLTLSFLFLFLQNSAHQKAPPLNKFPYLFNSCYSLKCI